jgi:putative glutamine amidotransferase
MRLVSGYYNDHYPFNFFNCVDSTFATSDPADLKEGDILLIWGGADIHPSLYHKPMSLESQASFRGPSGRDQVEWALMQRAKQLNIPIIGVCRGAQMLCALAGGYLMQHVSGHAGREHKVITFDGRELKVNSLHHQMMVPRTAEGKEVPHEVVAEVPKEALRSTVYVDGPNKVDHNQEPEFLYFPEVKGFAIQWHPEMMSTSAPATKYIQEYIDGRLGH